MDVKNSSEITDVGNDHYQNDVDASNTNAQNTGTNVMQRDNGEVLTGSAQDATESPSTLAQSQQTPETMTSAPTVEKAIAVIQNCIQTRSYAEVAFVIHGFRSRHLSINLESMELVRLLIKCLQDMNEIAGAEFFSRKLKSLEKQIPSSQKDANKEGAPQGKSKLLEKKAETHNTLKRKSNIHNSSRQGKRNRSMSNDGMQHEEMDTYEKGLQRCANNEPYGERSAETSIDFQEEERFGALRRSSVSPNADLTTVSRTDYVKKLEEITRERYGSYDYILPRNCNPSWRSWREGPIAKSTVLLELSRNRGVREARKKGTKDHILSHGRFEDKFSVQDVEPAEMAKRFAAKAMLDNLKELSEAIEKEACIRLGGMTDKLCTQWARNDWSEMRYKCGLKNVKKLVQRADDGMLYGMQVYAYGSATSGIALSSSDLDVSLVVPGLEEKDNDLLGSDTPLRCLRVLERQAHVDGMKHVVLISSARVPVLKYYDRDADLDVDVTMGNDQSMLVSRLIRKHTSEDVRIWNLCMLVKQWAKARLVSGAAERLINPMGWVIMVIFFLQHVAKPSIASMFHIKHSSSFSEPTSSSFEYEIVKEPWMSARADCYSRARTSTLLTHFFSFFAYDFDFGREVLSINLRHRTSMFELLGRNVNWPIFIEQPLKPKENVVGYVEADRLQSTLYELQRAAMLCQCQGDLSVVMAKKPL